MNQNLKILLVEDDNNLGNLLCDYLNAKGHNCTLRTNGNDGYQSFIDETFDFLILDVMMPYKDGFTLAKEIRGIDQEIPILFLTAKSLNEDTLKGFESGADDYMTKPFSMDELLARINAIMRRLKGFPSNEMPILQIGNYSFDTKLQKLIIEKEEQKLTTKETDLLKLLCKNKSGGFYSKCFTHPYSNKQYWRSSWRSNSNCKIR